MKENGKGAGKARRAHQTVMQVEERGKEVWREAFLTTQLTARKPIRRIHVSQDRTCLSISAILGNWLEGA